MIIVIQGDQDTFHSVMAVLIGGVLGLVIAIGLVKLWDNWKDRK